MTGPESHPSWGAATQCNDPPPQQVTSKNAASSSSPQPYSTHDNPAQNPCCSKQCNQQNKSCCCNNNNDHNNSPKQRRQQAKQALQQTWSNFNIALRSPEPFDQFAWMKLLSIAFIRYLYFNTRLDVVVEKLKLRQLWKPLVPMLAMVLILGVVSSYFSTFHELVVLERWCGGNGLGDRGSCVWSSVHPVIVIYFGTMILFHYVSTMLSSPGVALPITSTSHTSGNNQSQEEDKAKKSDVASTTTQTWKSVDGRGGCFFLEPTLNIEAERNLVALYKLIIGDTEEEQEENNDNDEKNGYWYYPSPQATFCDKCQIMRPPRCHHCSRCNRCVLQMDHHCAWMNNCIGYNNYRTFVLTVAYLAMGCWYGVALLLPSFWDIMGDQIRKHGFKFLYENKTGLLDLPPPWVMWKQIRTNGCLDPDVMIKIVCPFLCCVGIILSGFLWSHLSYISSAMTTLEYSVWRSVNRVNRDKRYQTTGSGTEVEAIGDSGNGESVAFRMKTPPINPFDQGRYANLQQVFGKNIFALFLPIPLRPPAPFIPQLKKKKKKS